MIDSKNDINGQELHMIKLQLGVDPAVVKTASVTEIEETAALESRHFANPVDRVFPVHTKEATERSIVYFFGNVFNKEYDSAYPAGMAEERLKKAARFWNVTDSFYMSKRASVEKVESNVQDTEYAMPGQKLPISTHEQIKKSAAALVGQSQQVAFKLRSDAALRILKAATSSDIDDKEMEEFWNPLQKMAGLCVRRRDMIANDLTERGAFLDRQGIDGEMYKMAATSALLCEDNDLDNLCEVLDAYEHTTKVAKLKLSGVEDLFYRVPYDTTKVSLSNGKEYDKDTIKKASLTPFYVLGESVPLHLVDTAGKLDFEKAASFLECLSREDADIYSGAVEQCLKK